MESTIIKTDWGYSIQAKPLVAGVTLKCSTNVINKYIINAQHWINFVSGF